jgi:phosphinothricin acetyltransferase
VHTRPVERADASAIAAIYNPEVIETTVTFDIMPRTLEEQEEWIDEHLGTHPSIVAVNDEDNLGEIGARGERILGFAVVTPFRARAAYATTVESSVYAHRGARGRGVGEVLLREIVEMASDLGFHALIARIVGENEGSIRLHEKVGFSLVGTEFEVGRKHGKWLDVVEYQFVIPDQH